MVDKAAAQRINSSQTGGRDSLPINNTLDQLNMIVDNIPQDSDCSNSDTSSL